MDVRPASRLGDYQIEKTNESEQQRREKRENDSDKNKNEAQDNSQHGIGNGSATGEIGEFARLDLDIHKQTMNTEKLVKLLSNKKPPQSSVKRSFGISFKPKPLSSPPTRTKFNKSL